MMAQSLSIINVAEITGWLSPNGDYYSCQPWCHGWLAQDICSRMHIGCVSAEVTLEQRGWVRLKQGLPLRGRKAPTDSQKQFVMDYYLMNKSEFTSTEQALFRDYSDGDFD